MRADLCKAGHELIGANLGSRGNCLACRRARYLELKRLKRVPGFYEGIPADEYHAGLSSPRPLSSTLAKNLLRMLPVEAHYRMDHSETKAAYTAGAALHELLLEGRLSSVVECEFDSWRSGEARQMRDQIIASGKRPMLTAELVEIRQIVKAVKSNPLVRELLPDYGRAEVSALAVLHGVKVQARFDYLVMADVPTGSRFGTWGWIVDVKTVAGSANPHDFNRSAANYGYHIQADLYQRVARALGHELPFYWLVVSKTPPFACSVIRVSDIDLTAGSVQTDKALKLWGDVLANGWPKNAEVYESELPGWVHYEDDDLELRGIES